MPELSIVSGKQKYLDESELLGKLSEESNELGLILVGLSAIEIRALIPRAIRSRNENLKVRI